jgi:TolA-binding protein
MEKKKNMYYGVSIDGLMLRIAEIEDAKGQLVLHRLNSFKLTKPLNTDSPDVPELRSSTRSSDIADRSDSLDVDLESEVANIDIMSDDYGSSPSGFDDDSMDYEYSDVPRPTVEKPNTENSFQNDAVYQFLSSYLLDSGKISISCIDGKAQWKPFRINKKGSKNELKKRVLSDYQMKDPNCHVDFLEHADFNYTGVIHQGDFELMALLNKAGQMVFNARKPLYFQYIEPIEVSMLNLFNIFYTNEIGRYTTLIFIGEESKLGIVIKNKEIVKTFPIMVTGRDPESIREGVLAKLLLEQENSDCPIIENMVIAGTFATREDIEFYNKKTGGSHKLFELDAYELKKYKYDFSVSGSVDPRDIPGYIPSIALALRGVMHKNKELLQFNLLPKKIIESHNFFNLKWYGILLVLAIIAVLIYGNTENMRAKTRLAELKTRYDLVNRELKEKEEFKAMMDTLQSKVDEVMAANMVTASIASKNVWNDIFFILSDFSIRNPMCWITAMSLSDNNVVLRGTSYHRDRITNLAHLFVQGRPTRVVESDIEGHTVWDFEITFPRPDNMLISQVVLPEYLQTFENYVQFVTSTQSQRDFQAPTPEVTEDSDPAEVVASQPQTTPPVAPASFIAQTPATPVAPQAPATPVAPQAPVAPPKDDFDNPKALYDLARDKYLSNDFSESITLLDIYVSKFPNGAEISLTHYLLGEINYVLNNFETAVKNFLEVYRIKKDKVAESLFFTGKSFEGLSDYENAKKYYQILIAEYPSNPLARTANEQLRNLNGEYQ